MQYGSIGWSVGATLGYAQAATDKRVIACIGDGSFQVSKHYKNRNFVCSRTLMIKYCCFSFYKLLNKSMKVCERGFI